MTRTLLFGAVLGVLVLLLLKYVVLGLNVWDRVLHPQRTEPNDSMFLKPFFGWFTKGCNGCNS